MVCTCSETWFTVFHIVGYLCDQVNDPAKKGIGQLSRDVAFVGKEFAGERFDKNRISQRLAAIRIAAGELHKIEQIFLVVHHQMQFKPKGKPHCGRAHFGKTFKDFVSGDLFVFANAKRI
jgi:hypothetical protein